MDHADRWRGTHRGVGLSGVGCAIASLESRGVLTPARKAFFVGLALAIVGSVLFSAKAVLVKLAYRYGVDAATLIALRMAVAGPFFIVAYVWSSRGRPPLAPADHVRLIVIGLLGYYAASTLDFLGL